MILIYVQEPTARSNYIFDFIFFNQLGIAYSTTNDLSKFESFNGAKIFYGTENITDSLFIQSAGVLFDHGLRNWQVPVDEIEGIKVLFPSKKVDALGFDIFSSCFYLLSRYEEYLPHHPDALGRFKAVESIAYQHQFLHLPIIDLWIEKLGSVLQQRFPLVAFKTHTFRSLLSYDIDVAFKYSGRSLWRNAGACIKDLLHQNFSNIRNRFKVILGKKQDDWDIYDNLFDQLQTNKLESIFFFLVGNKSEHDRNLSIENRHMQQLVEKTASNTNIGLHPSMVSNGNPTVLLMEKKRLEDKIHQPIIHSRQHYLKLQFPGTYLDLEAAGIKEDYSMGYPEMPGFRAGTCFPFRFFDLKNEKALNLIIHPVTVMDATFKYYAANNHSNPWEKISELIDQVRTVDGTFLPIWHNDNLSNDASGIEWKQLHNQMIQKLIQLKRSLE